MEKQPEMDALSKHDSYRDQFIRLSKAQKEGFNLEAIWILYSMMEDRTLSFLYHVGFSVKDDWTQIAGSEDIRAAFRSITGRKQIKSKYRFDKLEEKINVIRALSVWANTEVANSGYESRLKSAVKGLEIIPAIDIMKDWKEKRNGLMHHLFDMPGEKVTELLVGMSNEGLIAVRTLDKAIQKLKRKNLREPDNNAEAVQ
jgi:hypothetical protein